MDRVGYPDIVQPYRPREWFVVFQPSARARSWWLRLMPVGHYKHVLAFAPIENAGVWILVNVGWDRTELAVIADADLEPVLTETLYGADVVAVPAGEMPRRLPHFGFWCVPAIAHIVGVKSSALRPDAFLRDCLAQGGRWIDGRATGTGSEGE